VINSNNTRLARYFANLSTRKRSAADWRIYAAATGSAMAMATNASAGVIYFNQAITAGPVANVPVGQASRQSQRVALKSEMGGNIGVSFKVGVFQSCSSGGTHVGAASIKNATSNPNFALLFDTANAKLKKLAFGAHISTVHGVELGSGGDLASQTTSANVLKVHGWAATATGLAGFRFTTANHERDYGWVRLSYTLGTNGLANSITATDWAYESTGAPITAGETSSSTPEPSTTALAILAAGAAGLAALRRRRHEFNQ
jgi:MYXO-CTERM domain-containing protein